MTDVNEELISPQSSRKRWLKPAIFVLIVALFATIYFRYGSQLNLSYLAEREAQLRELQKTHWWQVYVGAFLIYVLVSALSIPAGATVMTLGLAWYFGFWKTLILVSFASTLGATLAFWSSRYLFRDAIEARFSKQVKVIDDAFEKEGNFYLFSLRLVPAVPFFMVNLIVGLTPIKTFNYWWISQIGMLPATAAYVFAGSSVKNLSTLAEEGPGNLVPLLLAFALVGLFPWIAKYGMKIFRGKNADKNETDAGKKV